MGGEGRGDEPVDRDLEPFLRVVEELELLRGERYGDAPLVIVEDEAPGVFVQDGRVHRTPLVDDEAARALYRAGRKSSVEPSFRDAMRAFAEQDLRRRRGVDGSGRTGS